MVEWGGLENRYARKRIEGSNPSLSATLFDIVCLWDESPIRGFDHHAWVHDEDAKQPEG